MARKKHKQTNMFLNGEDLPLFSRVAQRAYLPPYDPHETPDVQQSMPGFRWQPTMREMFDNRAKILRPKRRRRRRR